MKPAALLVSFLLLPTLSAPILACGWDSDTLEAEARGVPDVISALSGRFARNPPLFTVDESITQAKGILLAIALGIVGLIVAWKRCRRRRREARA